MADAETEGLASGLPPAPPESDRPPADPASDASEDDLSAVPPADAVRTASPAESRLRVVAKKTSDEPGHADHRSLYKELLAGMYDAVIVTDPSGRIIDSNARATDYFGYGKAELWDQPIDTLIRSLNAQILAHIHKTIAGKRHVLLDTLCRRRDGESFAAEVAVSGIHLVNDGDLVFFIRNTERRRRAQQRLRSEHLAILASPATFALCGEDGAITFANPAFAAAWGFSSEVELEGYDIRTLWTDPDAFERIFTDVLSSGNLWRGKLVAAGLDGRIFALDASLAADRDLHGRVCGALFSAFEVAE
ncbi:MAG: PAS domain-containing protein [Kiritimatiellia bacterium]